MNGSRTSRLLFLVSSLFLGMNLAHAAPAFLGDSGVRLPSANPQVVVSTSSDFFRLFFIRDNEVRSATSLDQLSWTEESGVRLSSSDLSGATVSSVPITGCSVHKLTTSGYRMIYSVGLDTGPYEMRVATSSDGLAFGSPSTAAVIKISTGSTPTLSPKIMVLRSGAWRLYYAQGTSASSTAVRGIYTALSSDEGVTWSTTTALNITNVGEVAVSSRTDNRIRLFYTSPPVALSTPTRINLFSSLSDSSDGTSFSLESGARISTNAFDGSMANPVVIRSTESYRFRLLYNFNAYPPPTSAANTFSAFTSTADVRSASPSEIVNNTTAATLTIRGEIFSTAPTIKLTRSGQTDIVGTSVNRADDQNVTVVVNPSGADIGDWNLVFTNDDGQSVTAVNAIHITYPSGNLTLTDNLLRPRFNNITTVDPEIFIGGDLTVRIYTVDGILVKTLYDGSASAGTTSLTWDGTNDRGEVVASGTYLVKAQGPKLDSLKKIIVIR